MSDTPLISTDGLSVTFRINAGAFKKFDLKAVEGISIDIPKGSFFGIVGESRVGQNDAGPRLVEGRRYLGRHGDV